MIPPKQKKKRGFWRVPEHLPGQNSPNSFGFFIFLARGIWRGENCPELREKDKKRNGHLVSSGGPWELSGVLPELGAGHGRFARLRGLRRGARPHGGRLRRVADLHGADAALRAQGGAAGRRGDFSGVEGGVWGDKTGGGGGLAFLSRWFFLFALYFCSESPVLFLGFGVEGASCNGPLLR